VKKIIVGVVLVLIIVGVGAPFVTGLLMEKVIKQSYGDINKLYRDIGSGVSVEILQYNRGVSASEIEWRVKVRGMDTFNGVDEITFVDQVKHGYTSVISTTTLTKNTWYSDFVKDKLKGKDPLHITTEYKLLGDIESTVVVDGFSFEVASDVVEIGPGKVVTECDQKLKNFISEASWTGVTVPGKFKMEGVSVNYDLEMFSTFIWDGVFSFAIEKSKLDVEKESVQFTNLKGNYVLSFDKGKNTLSIGSGFGVDSLVAGPDRIGKSFVHIGVNNMDAPGYEEFMKLYVDTVNEVIGGIIEAEDDPQKMKTVIEAKAAATGLQMMAAYQKILKKGLEIQVSDLSVQLPQGEVKGDVALKLNKDMTFMQFIPIAGQPELALDIFSLQSDVSLPLELVGENPMLLSPAYPGMQTGLFVKKGDTLAHKAETKDGKLLINGEAVVF